MKKFFSSVCSALVAPVCHYPVPFVFTMLLLFIPECCYIFFGDYGFLFSIKLVIGLGIARLFDNICIYFLCSYIMVGVSHLLSLWNKRVANVHLVIANLAYILLVFSDLFLFVFFDTHINAYIFQLIDETNPQETNEFVSTYLLTWNFLWIILTFIGVLLIECCLIYLCHKYIRLQERVKRGLCVGIMLYFLYSLVYFVANVSYFSFDPSRNIDDACKNSRSYLNPQPLGDNCIFVLYNSIIQFVQQKGSFDQCAEAQKLLGEPTRKGNSVTKLVWIIGESYNRHHAHLYGYEKQTTPFTSDIEDLIVYDDVITYSQGTSRVFRDIMSVSSRDDSLEWCDVPLAPCIIKKAGINVIFWSNQFPNRVKQNVWSAACGFFHHPGIAPYFYDHTATETCEYDGDFIDGYKAIRDSIETDSCNLIILHLMGQHVAYASRCPKKQKYFTEKDYLYRKELGKTERQQVADYDNATRYNDSIVAEIINMYKDEDAIVLYFADHGEEANDYRPHVGRSHHLDNANVCHCLLDIPFVFYLSPLCRQLHPELCERIEAAKHQPFMTDDTPHFLFDILGIQSEWYDSTRSPINPVYNADRKRIILGGRDYDQITQSDAIWTIGY